MGEICRHCQSEADEDLLAVAQIAALWRCAQALPIHQRIDIRELETTFVRHRIIGNLFFLFEEFTIPTDIGFAM